MDFVFAAIGALCYFSGRYDWALWIAIFAVAISLLAVVKSVADPSWYAMKRMEAGLEPGPGPPRLIIAKIIRTVIWGAVAWWLAGAAGYLI
jgi:hypothetical protein